MVKYTKGMKRLLGVKKQKEKYPDLLRKIIEMSDIILEVLDARFIQETRNTEFEEKAKEKNKIIIYVLNKADLVNRRKIKKEVLNEIKPYIFISSKQRKGGQKLRDLIKQEARKIDKTTALILRQGKLEESQDTKKIIVGVLGYPNTGKSSLINFLIGKSSAGTGSDAGFTKAMQKLKLTSDISLIDTPGVIAMDKYSCSNPEAISYHAKVGSRSYSQVRDPETIIANLIREYPRVFEKFYKIEANGDSEILLEELGKIKNIFKKGGAVDTDKSARIVLRDWQEGRIKF